MIIALTGTAGSGKSTVACALQAEILLRERPAHIERFAGEVKRIARECFGWDGEKDEKGRRLLQVIGTEAGREYNPQIWVDKLMDRIDGLAWRGGVHIIDDCRFPNEARAVLDRHGIVVRVRGRGGLTGGAAEHASEIPLDDSWITLEFDNSVDSCNELFAAQIQRVLAMVGIS